jgi:hypothetical protein
MQSMPLTSGPAGSCASLRQVPTAEYQFPLTKSPRVHKDAGISREKTAGKLGRVAASNMQPDFFWFNRMALR